MIKIISLDTESLATKAPSESFLSTIVKVIKQFELLSIVTNDRTWMNE